MGRRAVTRERMPMGMSGVTSSPTRGDATDGGRAVTRKMMPMGMSGVTSSPTRGDATDGVRAALRMGRGGGFFVESAGDVVGSGLVGRRQTASRGGGRAVIGSARGTRYGDDRAGTDRGRRLNGAGARGARRPVWRKRAGLRRRVGRRSPAEISNLASGISARWRGPGSWQRRRGCRRCRPCRRTRG